MNMGRIIHDAFPVLAISGYHFDALAASHRFEVAVSLRWFDELLNAAVPSHTSARARYRHNRDPCFLRP